MSAPLSTVSTLTVRQRQALDVLRSEAHRGFDLAELARRLGTSREGAAKTAASLARRGLAEKFMGGVGIRRVYYQAVSS